MLARKKLDKPISSEPECIDKAFAGLLKQGEFITKIAAGSYHTLFLTNFWRVFGIGKSSEGQLGFKDTNKNV